MFGRGHSTALIPTTIRALEVLIDCYEEIRRSCNNEEHDDYDEMALVTMEMERLRQSFGGGIRPKLE